ncbi:PAS domain-containing protein [Streptomyces sp. NPDC092296]|uniref:response regulator n=1 Tax=Streptomyces sp. NPDC092296 TaxID=3366012 RepID=UPI003817C730
MSSRPTRGAARLAAILDALPDALLLVNSNGTVVDANTAAVESLQAPGTSLVGMGVLGLLPEFDPSRIPGSMRPAPKERQSADRPVRMTAHRTDGTTFPVEVSSNDFEDEGAQYSLSPLVPFDAYRSSYGSPGPESSARELLLILVRDLSDRLDVEAELRRQHKQTEMILRAAAEGIVGVDLEGRVVLVNPAAAHILGFRASELGGRELHPLIQHSRADGTALAAEESPLADTLVSGRKHRVRGTVLWRKDGRSVTVDLTTAPVRDGEQLVGAVMTFTDRTKELALAARGRHLTAVLEDELRGPLDRLRSRIDGLAADPAGQLWPEANWTLRRLADECARFSRLVDGVLSYQRFEAAAEGGQDALDRKPEDLEKVVQRAVAAAAELIGADRVRISLHAAPVEVVADAKRLTQALAHLVADVSGIALSPDDAEGAPRPAPAPYGAPALPPAAKSAPVVVMAAAQRGDVARIEVRGDGNGGSPVHLPIARGVVERHGGVLQSHRLPDGKGTTYVVELPLDPVAARAAAERAGAAGRRDAPRESDTAVLPELPDGIPALPAARRSEEDAPPGKDAPGKGIPTEGSPTEDGAAKGSPVRDTAARNSAAKDGASKDGAGQGASGEKRPAVAAPAEDRPAEAPPAARGPIALGPGPSAAPAAAEGPRPPRQRTPADEPRPGGPAGEPAPPEGGGQRRHRARPAREESASYESGPYESGPYESGPYESGPYEPAGPLALDAAPAPAPPPGVAAPPLENPFAGVPVYPGLENALPPAGPVPPAPVAPVPPPTGRRRRLAVPPADDAQAAAGPAALEPAAPAPARPAGGGPIALEPARPEPAGPFVVGPGGLPGAVPPGSGVPVPDGAPGSAPAPVRDQAPLALGPAPTTPAPVPVPEPAPAVPGPPTAPAVPGPPTPPHPIAVPPLTGTDETDGAGLLATGAPEAAPDGPPGGAAAAPRRLLVWPEPDPSTKQALKDRGYRPVIVRSREEVDAQVGADPAALFVDPLTGPITRTALQSLRTAAVNARVPVLVTAGLGQATREAAYGADPAVLLRALSPRDSESHAPRVLLVEAAAEIATAFSSSLERRGMHVEHAASESDAVSRASSVQPNLVVMDLMLVRRRRVGIVDWLRANDRLHRTPLVVYTSADIDPQELPRLRTGETVLFLAERSTSEDVQARIVDLLGKIGSPLSEGH